MAESYTQPAIYQSLYNVFAKRVSFVVAAGAFFDIEEGHTFFRVETGVNVNVLFNATGQQTFYPAGTGYNFPDFAAVKRVRVINGDAAPQTITVYYGAGSFLDSRVTISGTINIANTQATPIFVEDVAATIPTIADVAIAATTTTQVIGANAARKGVMVSNLAANNTVVRVGDASTGAARGQEIPKGGSAFVPTLAAVFVFNPTGAGINIGIDEYVN